MMQESRAILAFLYRWSAGLALTVVMDVAQGRLFAPASRPHTSTRQFNCEPSLFFFFFLASLSVCPPGLLRPCLGSHMSPTRVQLSQSPFVQQPSLLSLSSSSYPSFPFPSIPIRSTGRRSTRIHTPVHPCTQSLLGSHVPFSIPEPNWQPCS